MSNDLFTTLDRAAGRTTAQPGLDALVGGLLTQIARGTRVLRAVAHPLGFYCLPVVRDGALGVCVHVFDPVTAAGQREIHCHSWELKSSVLYGRIGNVRIGVYDEAARPTHRAYEVHSDAAAGVDEVRPTARLVRWRTLAEQTSGRGETYTLGAGEFHATVLPDGTPTATVVLGRTVPGPVDVVLGPVDGAARRVVRRLCDTDRTARIADEAVRRIGGRYDSGPG
ncbi:hypothetical protein ACFXAF_04730 [Kitasatospora sp. NPDC059463]|uniref:hypothetical protein n=1 Tax=unclassified Kitasatospora TaxID=2633591 RepID=UPI0036C3439E